MSKNCKTKKIHLILISIIANFLIFQITFAKNTQTVSSDCESDTTKTVACMEVLCTKNSTEEPKLESFIQEHFLSKKANSELIDGALEKLIVYENVLDLTLKQWAEQYDQGSIDMLSEDIQFCQSWIRSKHKQWADYIESRITKTSKAKATIKIVDTLKRINKQLIELNIRIARLKALIEGFATLLPCYSQSCKTK